MPSGLRSHNAMTVDEAIAKADARVLPIEAMLGDPTNERSYRRRWCQYCLIGVYKPRRRNPPEQRCPECGERMLERLEMWTIAHRELDWAKSAQDWATAGGAR